MFKLRSLFFLILFSLNLYSIEVIITADRINYNEVIKLKDIRKSSVTSVKKYCKPLTASNLNTTSYVAKHYMPKGYVICMDDVKEYKKNSVVFNFGSIQIEKEGKVIFENDEYIRIKNRDGKIEKFYKDGRTK
jgi:hypothetical protein